MSKKASQEENGQNIASWRRKNPSSSADQKGYVYCRQPRKHTAMKGFYFPPDSLEIKKMDIPTVDGWTSGLNVCQGQGNNHSHREERTGGMEKTVVTFLTGWWKQYSDLPPPRSGAVNGGDSAFSVIH